MRYAGLGIEIAAAVGLLSLLGWWIDGRLGSAPWGLVIGAMVGLIGGMANLLRSALSSVERPGGHGAGDSGGDGAGGGDRAGRGEP
jgi:F0F1-type ATP synthase assembly protein I